MVGTETAVNTSNDGIQIRPDIAMDADGDFVIAWDSAGAPTGIRAQRFNERGVPQGAEFEITTSIAAPDIAMEDTGDFVVVWSEGPTASSDVFARRFAADGTPLAAAFRVNSFTTGAQQLPSVAMDANGDFVVAWQSDGQDGSGFGVFAKRYNNAGTALTGDVQLAGTTAGDQDFPDVACNDTLTSFVVAWTTQTDGSSRSVAYRVFDGNGAPTTSETRANQFTTGGQTLPEVAMDDSGDFVVAWHSSGQVVGQTGTDTFARRYNAAGTAQGNEFLVNTDTDFNESLDDVAMNDEGRFMITWSYTQAGPRLVKARAYLANGTADGGEVVVNGGGAQDYNASNVAFRGDSVFVTYEDAFNAAGSDEIVMRRLAFDVTNPLAPSAPNLQPTSDSGESNSDDITNDTTPTFLVVGEDEATLELLVDGVLAATDFASNGIFLVTIPDSFNLSDGVRQITARQRDLAGNLSPVGAALAVTIDTVSPGAPSVPDLLAGSDTGISNSDNITRDNTPQVAGSAENGTTVEIIEGATVHGAVTTDAGVYGLTLPALSDGVHPLQARAIDVAGNVGAASGILNITVDTLAPPTPGLADLLASSDTGISNTDGITADNTPTFIGEVPANDIVRLFANGALVGSDTTTAAGAYAITASTLADGSQIITARFEDLAGNLSLAGSGLVTIIDTIAPPSPTAAPDLTAASDLGVSSTDNITRDNTPTFTGTAPGNHIVRLLAGGVEVGFQQLPLIAPPYNVTSSTLADGNRVMTTRFEDIAGNTSASVSPSLTVRIDTVAPTLTNSGFNFLTSQNLRFSFSEDLGGGIAVTDFALKDVTNNVNIPNALLAMSYIPNNATVTFPGFAGEILTDADWQMRVSTNVTDIAGNTFAGTQFDFFFLNGDANRDRRVNLSDFNIMAANFGQSPRNFSHGDFNYDTIVNLSDFDILAGRFGAALSAGATAAGSGALFGQTRLDIHGAAGDEILE
jgi:hypothetical protein